MARSKLLSAGITILVALLVIHTVQLLFFVRYRAPSRARATSSQSATPVQPTPTQTTPLEAPAMSGQRATTYPWVWTLPADFDVSKAVGELQADNDRWGSSRAAVTAENALALLHPRRGVKGGMIGRFEPSRLKRKQELVGPRLSYEAKSIFDYKTVSLYEVSMDFADPSIFGKRDYDVEQRRRQEWDNDVRWKRKYGSYDQAMSILRGTRTFTIRIMEPPSPPADGLYQIGRIEARDPTTCIVDIVPFDLAAHEQQVASKRQEMLESLRSLFGK